MSLTKQLCKRQFAQFIQDPKQSPLQTDILASIHVTESQLLLSKKREIPNLGHISNYGIFTGKAKGKNEFVSSNSYPPVSNAFQPAWSFLQNLQKFMCQFYKGNIREMFRDKKVTKQEPPQLTHCFHWNLVTFGQTCDKASSGSRSLTLKLTI